MMLLTAFLDSNYERKNIKREYRGRKPIGKKAMSNAERQKRWRDSKRDSLGTVAKCPAALPKKERT